MLSKDKKTSEKLALHTFHKQKQFSPSINPGQEGDRSSPTRTEPQMIIILLLGNAIYADLINKGNEGDKLILSSELVAEENIILQDRNTLNESGKVGTLEILEESFADLKACNAYGETLLHLAASEGRTEVLRSLLQRGLPVDTRTEDPKVGSPYRDTLQTPVHYAAAAGQTEALQVLAEHSADVTAVSESGDTPLHKAALHGHTAAVLWLLDRGADVNAENVFGATPLAMALVNQRVEAAGHLLRHGARGSAKEDVQAKEVDHWLSQVQSNPVLLIVEFAAMLIYRLLRN